MRVLIVEDDSRVADLVARAVREAAWAADCVVSGEKALEALAATPYDLVILDLRLPGMDGLEVCRRYRRSQGSAPILMLTARDGLSDRVEGLDAGADDYLPKPFAVPELMARLRALARRHTVAPGPLLTVDDLELDPVSHEVRRAGTIVHLTAREFALLEYLMRHSGRVFERGQIIEHVWDDNFEPVANVVDVLIGRLRRKLDLPGCRPVIHTVRGVGYAVSDKEP